MTTPKQLIANRRNAQRSTGPRTPQGKAAVSQNAVKHGLSAQPVLSSPALSSVEVSKGHDVISSESQADFDLYRQQLFDELNPLSPMESMLAERIVTLSWRLKRVSKIQNQTIDALHAANTASPLTKLTQSFLSKYHPNSQLSIVNNQSQTSAAELALGRLAIKDFANARILDRLLMYERRIENSLYKTILELQRLNLVKNMNTGREMLINQL